MNTSALKAAIEAARAEVKNAIDAEIAARRFGGLKQLAAVDEALVNAGAKLELAEKRSQPKTRKSKKAAPAADVAPAPATGSKKK